MIGKLVLRALALTLLVAVTGGADWLHFRGTDNTSVSAESALPDQFADGQNVAWKIALPGRGPASPIVLGDRVIVLASSGAQQDRLHVLAYRTADGSPLWHRQLWATGHTAHHPFGAVAANTPASDGDLIFAFYSSNDLACFDLDGNLQWFRGLASDFPTMRNDVGMASSPLALHKVVVVQCHNQGTSFVAGIDKTTGITRWKLDREHESLWSSPTVLRGRSPAEDVVLLQSRTALTGHDPDSGEELFRFEADCHTTASVTTCGNRIFLPANGLHALDYDPAKRDVEHVWFEARLRGGNSSPVVAGDSVLRLTGRSAVLACADAADGGSRWQVRLEGAKAIWATPVVAGDLAFIPSHDGNVFIVRLGEQGELVSTNPADPGLLATPAIADGALYLRSDSHLWKIQHASHP